MLKIVIYIQRDMSMPWAHGKGERREREGERHRTRHPAMIHGHTAVARAHMYI